MQCMYHHCQQPFCHSKYKKNKKNTHTFFFHMESTSVKQHYIAKKQVFIQYLNFCAQLQCSSCDDDTIMCDQCHVDLLTMKATLPDVVKRVFWLHTHNKLTDDYENYKDKFSRAVEDLLKSGDASLTCIDLCLDANLTNG